jgi:hypothetical protein
LVAVRSALTRNNACHAGRGLVRLLHPQDLRLNPLDGLAHLGAQADLSAIANNVANVNSTAVKKSKADAFAQEIAGVINEMLVGGESLRNIADGLNNAGFKTRKGDKWQAMSVKRVLDRIATLPRT